MDNQIAGISSQRFAFLKSNTRKKSVFARNKISTFSSEKLVINSKKPINNNSKSNININCTLPMKLLIKLAAKPALGKFDLHEDQPQKNVTKNNKRESCNKWNRSQFNGCCVSENAITTFDDCYMTKVNVEKRVWRDADPNYIFPMPCRQPPGGNSHLTRSLVAMK